MTVFLLTWDKFRMDLWTLNVKPKGKTSDILLVQDARLLNANK